MRELIDNFLETSKERIKNPFIGSFILSWIVFNWKPISILIFSSKIIEEKIKIIETNYASLDFNLWFPLSFSFFYIIILPYLMWLLENLSNKALRGRKENIVKEQVFDIISKQKLAKEESVLESIRADYKEKADLNKQIERLNQQLFVKEDRLEALQLDFDNLINEKKIYEEALRKYGNFPYTPMEKNQLNEQYEKFENSDIFEYFYKIGTEISSRNYIPNDIDNIIIEKYKLNDIIIKVINEETENAFYNFTLKGKYFWKEFVMNLKIQKDEDDLPF